MRKTRTTQIGGQQWVLVEHPATEGLSILRNISTLAGQAIGALTGAKPSSPLEAGSILALDIGIDAIGRVAETLLERLSDEKVVWLIKLICKYVQDKDGPLFPPEGKERFDDVFAGSYGLLGQVVAWVLQENFSEVFLSTGIGELFGAGPGKNLGESLRHSVKPSVPATDR